MSSPFCLLISIRLMTNHFLDGAFAKIPVDLGLLGLEGLANAVCDGVAKLVFGTNGLSAPFRRSSNRDLRRESLDVEMLKDGILKLGDIHVIKESGAESSGLAFTEVMVVAARLVELRGWFGTLLGWRENACRAW